MNSRCNAACPCGDHKAKAPKGLTKAKARVIAACWASWPVGLIATVVTGDLRPGAVSFILAATATFYGYVVVEASRKVAGQ